MSNTLFEAGNGLTREFVINREMPEKMKRGQDNINMYHHGGSWSVGG